MEDGNVERNEPSWSPAGTTRPLRPAYHGENSMSTIDRERLLQRFLRYVQVDTTADDRTDDYPSSDGQRELGRIVAGELTAIGLHGVRHDEWGLVWAGLPGTVDRAPTIAFNAHFDTSPETTGAGVSPQVIESYDGGDIVLPGDRNRVITVAANPELESLVGKTLITSDGTTLLGADDKAGLAVIVETLAWLVEHPDHARCPVRVVFTCDEEIGRGVQHLDVERLEAVAAYTLDGPGADQIDIETFSADLAVVTIEGVNIHPSIAKDRMVNAIRGVGHFLTQLPNDRLSPETTEGRQGFLHPYQISGGVDRTEIRILLRDFDTERLNDHAGLLHTAAEATETAFPGMTVRVDIQRQYRNLGDGLAREPRAVQYAVAAHQRLDREPKLSVIRGGTDGSLMTEKELPTPNLATGQHNPHSPLEWACLDEMVAAAEVLIELVRVWAEDPLSEGVELAG